MLLRHRYQPILLGQKCNGRPKGSLDRNVRKANHPVLIEDEDLKHSPESKLVGRSCVNVLVNRDI